MWKHHAVKTWESGLTIPRIVISAPDGSEWTFHAPASLSARNDSHSTRCVSNDEACVPVVLVGCSFRPLCVYMYVHVKGYR